jgi:chromosome segregation ATPase
MSKEEIIINDIKEIIPTFNNNIASFKSIVHKLERNYKFNKYNIDYLKNDIKNINKDFDEFKDDLEEIKINIDNLKKYTMSIKEELNEKISTNSNIDQIDIRNKFYKYTIDINTKFMIFTFFNITVSAIVFFFK